MSVWQTRNWQEMLKKSGQVSDFFEIGNIFIEKRKVAIGEYGLFAIWIDKLFLNDKIIKKLKLLCKKQKALFIQIEVLDYENISNLDNLKSLFKNRKESVWFKKWYYKKFITPYTALIDLKLDENDILSAMKPKWRYNISLARKKWISCKIVKKTDENIKKFYDMMVETTNRDKFSWNTFDYYNIFLQKISKSELLLAYKDSEVVSGGIFVFDKNVSIYYYWVSSNKYRSLMSPYLLQWTAIKYAKSIWGKLYDFLWVASPYDNSSSLSWVTDFKKKLTKDVRHVSESYIFVNKHFKYALIKFLRRFR